MPRGVPRARPWKALWLGDGLDAVPKPRVTTPGDPSTRAPNEFSAAIDRRSAADLLADQLWSRALRAAARHQSAGFHPELKGTLAGFRSAHAQQMFGAGRGRTWTPTGAMTGASFLLGVTVPLVPRGSGEGRRQDGALGTPRAPERDAGVPSQGVQVAQAWDCDVRDGGCRATMRGHVQQNLLLHVSCGARVMLSVSLCPLPPRAALRTSFGQSAVCRRSFTPDSRLPIGAGGANQLVAGLYWSVHPASDPGRNCPKLTSQPLHGARRDTCMQRRRAMDSFLGSRAFPSLMCRWLIGALRSSPPRCG